MSWPVLAVGSGGPEVGNLQRFLVAVGARDHDGRLLVVDEAFGPRTASALRYWQEGAGGLAPTGRVDARDRAMLRDAGFIPFIQARHYTKVFPAARKRVDWLVVHTTEGGEKPGSAEAVGRWFASAQSSKASCHYGADAGGVVQYVREADIAWQAPGANDTGIGIELCGKAAQASGGWGDEASVRILAHGAMFAASIAHRYRIPAIRVPVAEMILKPPRRGIIGHVDATKAFPGQKRTHWDPGEGFPWEAFLDRVRREVEAIET